MPFKSAADHILTIFFFLILYFFFQFSEKFYVSEVSYVAFVLSLLILFLISSSFDAWRGLCFMIVAFPGYSVNMPASWMIHMKCLYFLWKSKIKVLSTVCVNSGSTLVLLNPDMPCLRKQCRSRSVGIFKSQLIWICIVCHSVCKFLSTNLDQEIWLADSYKRMRLLNLFNMEIVKG